MNQQDLTTFLIKAKKSTYANEKAVSQRLADGSRELVSQDGIWVYKDRWFGSNPLGGQELVFKEGKPVWMMNYYGHASVKLSSVSEIYEFLRKALTNLPESAPFRGPAVFEERYFSYRNHIKKPFDISNFSGKEEIFFSGEKEYCCLYNGGRL